MKAFLPLILLLCAAIAPAALQKKSEPPAPPGATLRWKNGETLGGELLAATKDEITWQTPFFADPVRVQMDALHHIVRQQEAREPVDPFSVVLRDGSHLYGQLTAITKESILLQGTRHGELTLRRSEVLRVRRWKSRGLVMSGPLGDVGWKPLASAEKEKKAMQIPGLPFDFGNPRGGQAGEEAAAQPVQRPGLVSGPGGALPLLSWNLAAYRDVNLPKLVELDFRVTATSRPDFHLALENGQNDQLHIETWNDDLVVASGWDFQRIRKVDSAERAVPLRVCWDREKQKFWVYDNAGKLLAEWAVFAESQQAARPFVPGATHRLSLRNKGRDLTLDSLSIREWDGAALVALDEKKPKVELVGGRVIYGVLTEASKDSAQVEVAGKEAPEQLALAEIDAIDFAPGVSPNPKDDVTLNFDDGTLLLGRVLGVKDGSATVAVASSEKPIAVKLDGLRRWLLNDLRHAAAGPAPQGDELVSGKTTMHGKVTGAGEKELRWLPVGGLAPVRLASLEGVKITRAIPGEGSPESAAALFYTRSGEILPGGLRGIAASGVELENSIVETKEIPLVNLAAVQFGIAANRKLTGFTDPEWRMVRGDAGLLKKPGESLVLQSGMSLGHPTALLSREVKFTLSNQGFGAARVRLFCPGLERARSLNLLIAQMSDRITTGIEEQEGQMAQQQQGRGQGNRTAEFRLVILEKSLELYVDGALWQTYPSDPASRAGVGLILEPASIWGNAVQPFTLAKFSSSPAPGLIAPPSIAPEAKLQALTVPRFRKALPPKHALVGLNGDILRGEIETMTATHFLFRSGLESLRVPRDRVKAVIWLQPPGAPPAGPPASMEPKLEELGKVISMRTSMSSLPLTVCFHFLKNEFPDITFVAPREREQRRVMLNLRGQTLKEVLEQICAQMDLSYAIEPNKRIVFTAGAAREKAFFSKSYWLPATAFPDPAAVKAALEAKGVEFPKESAVSWDAGARQLTMVNSSANHLKLVEVLREQFGDAVAAPTHWVQLTSGARLGLAVQKFEPELIRGTHPLYGECRIPLAQVYTIDTSPPAANAALQQLSDWRLVFAPEPVLPETGGESSPLLGKDAKAFTLPLIGGGEFDLAKSKGKVVVLDFWATWCGPCIRSLPALMEAMEAFPADKVEFIGVNEGEAEDDVKQFLEPRGWKLRTALDVNQTVGRDFGVDGIPHTVIVAPDGKVAWVKTGFSPKGVEEIAAAVKKLLEPEK